MRVRGRGLPWVNGLVVALFLMFSANSAAQQATPALVGTRVVDLSQVSGTIIADGSSTVWPITAEAAERFAAAAPVIIEVEISGTGGGFRRFCAGESDLQNASRPITTEEVAVCAASGVSYEIFPLAYDGITVTVNPANTWVQCLTVEQLRHIWEPDNPESSWRQLDPVWPDTEIELYGPGPDSGTFDYFTEVIVGEAGASRTDYTPSENDLDLVEGVAVQHNALGYFGFSYYEENAHRLRAVAIDSGNGCVLPTVQSIADGSYAPLSRPLFLYVNRESLARPEVQEFLRFTLDHIDEIVSTVDYVLLPPADYAASRDTLLTMLSATPAP